MKIKPSSPKISVSEMLDNLRDIFTVEEWKYINLHPEDRLRRFYHVWTAKEAYVKTIGTGLYTEPQCVSVDGLIEDVYHPRIAHAGNTDKSLKFTTEISESIIEDYVVAICAGPLEDCDKSWSKFCSSRDAVPSPVKLCSVVELKLEDLVSLNYPQCGHRDTEQGIFK
jgi:phosphopantetheine--protein transferase-like protein